MRRKIEQLIEERMTPFLQTLNGKIEVIDVDNDIVFIKLDVKDIHNVKTKDTLQYSIKDAILKTFPLIKSVIITP
jgi:Fe-S cluster biogenesis protein NfuA